MDSGRTCSLDTSIGSPQSQQVSRLLGSAILPIPLSFAEVHSGKTIILFQKGARIRAALRRRADPADSPEPFALGGLAIDYAERAVSVAGRPVELTDIEYRLLFELSVNAGRVLTHDELLDRVWGMDRRGGM